jgi:hypothetical protein
MQLRSIAGTVPRRCLICLATPAALAALFAVG